MLASMYSRVISYSSDHCPRPKQRTTPVTELRNHLSQMADLAVADLVSQYIHVWLPNPDCKLH